MFARWCQENFFRYMRQHYNLDRLAEYGVEEVPDTTRVINPAWRQLDSQIRRQNGLLSRQLVQFAEIQLPQELEPEQVQAYELSKGQLQQAIENRRQEIEQLKAQRKTVAKHILLKDLPEQSAFNSCGQRKNTSSIRSSSLLTGPKQPWPSSRARKCTASMMPVHSFANCSTPKSILFPTSKTKPLRFACIRSLPKFMTRSSGTSAKN